ncbi:hypothetical protein TNCT_18951 [Trichonephila clavata]|uniref:Uncharacterized protein n=1 Tax=Trichonephila clavata TaxID=2740835 RepID=A0A8X6KNY4_TRICU|nr:hypothetical protein TNCT_18951 [Trichonephila clavata]
MLLLKFGKFIVGRTYCMNQSLLKVSYIAIIKRWGKLVQPGRGRKRVPPVLVDDVKTVVDAQSDLRVWGSRARAVSRKTDYSCNTVRKVIRKHTALLPIHDPPNPEAA